VVLLTNFVFLCTSREIGWEECAQNDLFCVELNHKQSTNQSINQSINQSLNQSINQPINQLINEFWLIVIVHSSVTAQIFAGNHR